MVHPPEFLVDLERSPLSNTHRCRKNTVTPPSLASEVKDLMKEEARFRRFRRGHRRGETIGRNGSGSVQEHWDPFTFNVLVYDAW